MSQNWYAQQSGHALGGARQLTDDQYQYMYNQYQKGNLNQNSPVQSKWVWVPGGMFIPIPVKVNSLRSN